MVRLVSHNPAVPGAADKARRALLGKVHIAVKALGMLDDDYRELLHRVTGKRSAGDCDRRQLDAVIAEFERLGFTGKVTRPATPRAEHGVARKARAMWISLYQLGAIDDPSESSLEAFGARQLGVERLQWADQSQGFSLIEALKSMANRHGWDQRTPSRMATPVRIRLLKDRLVGAQLDALAALGVAMSGRVTTDRAEWSDRDLESAARSLADTLRKARADAREHDTLN